MIRKAGFNEIVAILFLIAASIGLYFQFSYHKFLNNDTLAYINIAELYAAGDWSHAINGFWSPFYSWILCFCKLAGLPLLQCCYIINFAVAGAGLYLLCKIAQRYITQPLFYIVCTIQALLLLLFYAMSCLTPDLMGAVFCLWFLKLVTDERFSFSNKLPFIAGIAAACMYFCKIYNFIPVHLFLGSAIVYELMRKNPSGPKQIIPFIKTYAVFIFISSLWITTLSIHEKKLTLNTVGRFNYNYVGPLYAKKYPTSIQLYQPPFEKAYCAHTNPEHLLDAYDWSPFKNSLFFKYQLQLIKDSALRYFKYLDSNGAKWLLLAASFIIIIVNRKKIKPLPEGIFKIGWFFLCFPLLYFPVFVLDRHIIICIILFLLFLFFALQLSCSFVKKKILLPVMVVLLIIGIVPFVRTAQKKLLYSSGAYNYYKSFYRQLSQISFLKNQKIASDVYSEVEAMQLCYYFGCSYYSTWSDKQYQSLKQYNIRYVIAKKDQASFPFLHLKEKMPGEKETIYIYEVQ